MKAGSFAGFDRLFAVQFPQIKELDALEERIHDKLMGINLCAETPLAIVLCEVDATRFRLQSSRLARKSYGVYLLYFGEAQTTAACLWASEDTYESVLKGVALTAKLLLGREVIPFKEFQFYA